MASDWGGRAAAPTRPLAVTVRNRWRVSTHPPEVGMVAGLQVGVDDTLGLGVENSASADVGVQRMAVFGNLRHLLRSQNRAALPVVERTAVVERTLPSSGERLAACAVVERTPAPDGGGAHRLCGGRA